jgi:hypothetical protein
MKPTKQRIRASIFAALALFILVGTTQDALAQDRKKQEKVVVKKANPKDAESEVIVVEIKNGKVIVDGKEVADVDAEGRKFWVQGSDKDDANVRVFGFKDEDGENTFSLFSSDDNEFVVEGKPNRFMFRSNNEPEMLAKLLEREQILSGLDVDKLTSRMAPMMERVRSFSDDGNGFVWQSGDVPFRADAETMKMDMKSRELAMKIRTSNGDTAEMKAELNQLLEDVFQKKQEANQQRIDDMRAELQKLEQRLEERRASQKEIIAKRKKELLGERDKYDW